MQYWFFFIPILAAVWTGWDARRRLADMWILWAASTFLFMALALPAYFACRPLRDGETREGGRPWNILKNFALTWTGVILLLTIWFILWAPSNMGDVSDTGAKVAATAVAVMIFGAVWFFPLVGALLLGFFLKKSSVVERGPTGRLAIRAALQDSTPIEPAP